MEDIAAERAAEWLLAEHKANHRFKTLGPPGAPGAISDAYDIQDKYVALLQR
jgi:2-keto-4-pentenoate hydratase